MTNQKHTANARAETIERRPRGLAALFPPRETTPPREAVSPAPASVAPDPAEIVRTLLDSAAVAIALLLLAGLALAWVLHRNPATELAGDLIAFAVARPIERVELAFPFALAWSALWIATLIMRLPRSGHVPADREGRA